MFFKVFIIISVQLLLSPFVNIGDILVHHEWISNLTKNGLTGSYFRSGWITVPTQPPLMMILFRFSGWLYNQRYVLAQLHNLIKIPPASTILWFDKNGFFILAKLWAVLGNLLAGLFVYIFFKKIKKRPKLAKKACLSFLINPIPFFIGSIWGQNGVLAVALAMFSLFFVFTNKFIFLSPLFYILSLQIKPTTLLVLPFYLFILFQRALKNKNFFKQIIIGGVISLSLFFLLFVPFIRQNHFFLDDTWSIFINRIAPSSKGVNKASLSAFNFYSLFWKIDQTLSSHKFLFLSLNQMSIIFLIIINFSAIYLWFKKKKQEKFKYSLFLVYFVSQASFLFTTNMIDRYFLPALIPSFILYFYGLKREVILQMVIWFVNLFYALFWRNIFVIKTFFQANDFFVIRLLSLANLVIFFIIIRLVLVKNKFR